MDMDAMVTDSHQLMMSEEQRHHLFKVRRALLCVCFYERTKVITTPAGIRMHSEPMSIFFKRTQPMFTERLRGHTQCFSASLKNLMNSTPAEFLIMFSILEYLSHPSPERSRATTGVHHRLKALGRLKVFYLRSLSKWESLDIWIQGEPSCRVSKVKEKNG